VVTVQADPNLVDILRMLCELSEPDRELVRECTETLHDGTTSDAGT
jgi:hypothetical protein